MGIMQFMDETGDTKLMWDKNNREEVDNARETFNRLSKKGYTGFSVKKNHEKGSVIHEFDEDAEKIIMAPAIAGG